MRLAQKENLVKRIAQEKRCDWLVTSIRLAMIAMTGCAGVQSTVSASDVLVGSNGQRLERPSKTMPYSSPELRYLGSSKPIPEPHLRCMRYVDDFYERYYLRLARMNEKDADVDRSFAILKRFAGIDWGISAKMNYAEWARENREKDIPKARKALAEGRTELAEAEAEMANMAVQVSRLSRPAARTMGGGALVEQAKAISALQDMVRYLENTLDLDESNMRFADCVASNGLTPTVE